MSSRSSVTHPVSPFTQTVVKGIHDMGTRFSTMILFNPRPSRRSICSPIFSTTVSTNAGTPCNSTTLAPNHPTLTYKTSITQSCLHYDQFIGETIPLLHKHPHERLAHSEELPRHFQDTSKTYINQSCPCMINSLTR